MQHQHLYQEEEKEEVVVVVVKEEEKEEEKTQQTLVKMYFELLTNVYWSNWNQLASFLPKYDPQRFNLVRVSTKPPKSKKARTNRNTPSAKPFNKVFNGMLYSKIGTELVHGRREQFMDYLVDILKLNEPEPNITGVHIAIALVQLALNKNNCVGYWIDNQTLKPCDTDILSIDELLQCCLRLSTELWFAETQKTNREENLLEMFNAENGSHLTLPELVFLQILARLGNVLSIQRFLNEDCVLEYHPKLPTEHPIENIFVPAFRSNVRNKNPLNWKKGNCVLDMVPECIHRHVRPAKVCNYARSGAAFKTLLIQLANNTEMMREWLVSVFFHYNFFGLCCKSDAKYKRIPLDNIMSVQLVDVDQTLCASIFCYGYSGQYIDNFIDMESVVWLEQTHKPAYAFISDTLGLYLRILHRINPRLYCPLKSDFFSILSDQQMFFSTIAPLMKDENKTKNDDDDDDDDEKE